MVSHCALAWRGGQVQLLPHYAYPVSLKRSWCTHFPLPKPSLLHLVGVSSQLGWPNDSASFPLASCSVAQRLCTFQVPSLCISRSLSNLFVIWHFAPASVRVTSSSVLLVPRRSGYPRTSVFNPLSVSARSIAPDPVIVAFPFAGEVAGLSPGPPRVFRVEVPGPRASQRVAARGRWG